MATSEEQELMAKIGSLASKINRHKAQQHNTKFGYHGPGRNRYRNKTLVLNGQSGSAQSVDANAASNSTSPSWVSKTDRHLQLINSAIYEKEAQSRSNAIEQTHRHRQLQKDNREKSKLANFARQNANHVAASSSASASAPKFEITVNGIHFHVLKGGNKLVKLPDDVNPPTATPKVAFIGGVRFHRTRNGNLVRHGIVRAQQQLLSKGTCPEGDSCDLSHEVTEERTPLCLHFAKGKCINPSCPYVHAQHTQSDPVCRAFGIYGYCDKGAQCPERHVYECPDFSNAGVCKMKGCKRPHIERASVLRRAGNRPSPEEMDDISSDDDFAADSDDIDSDGVEEFIGKDEVEDARFSEQTDFIGF
ncbi:hypothetical protein DL767_002661 [Monosporascus sp. MG133]|nr:hypothetical protein DL767_002661 [Monosporascus sp. MG133]